MITQFKIFENETLYKIGDYVMLSDKFLQRLSSQFVGGRKISSE